MTNCPKVYKNLQCESFGDKKKITSQMLRQFCKNDAYLYDQIKQLWDMTDPETRKRFYPPHFMDEANSYGIESHILRDCEKIKYDYLEYVYRFSQKVQFTKILNFDVNDDGIVSETTDTVIEKNDNLLDLDYDTTEKLLQVVREDDGNGGYYSYLYPQIKDKEVVFTTDEIPPEYGTQYDYEYKTHYVTKNTKKEVLGNAHKDAYCNGPYKNWHCNTYWYVGYNHNKNYNVKDAWRKNPDSTAIPTICRAQTFTAESTGRVSKVSLNMKGSKNTVSPCIVEIRTTTKKGYPTQTVLARTEKRFTHSGNSIEAFTFKDKAKIEKGKKYAIVIRSPLSNINHTYRLGGWAHSCFSSMKKEAYYKGDSFLSENNGKTWIHYGKNDNFCYAEGQHYPIDFGFEVYVQPITYTGKKEKVKVVDKKKVAKKVVVKEGKAAETETIDYKVIEKGDYFLYLKPIIANQIKSVQAHINLNASSYVGGYTGSITWEWFNPETKAWEPLIDESSGVDYMYYDDESRYNYVKLRLKMTIPQETLYYKDAAELANLQASNLWKTNVKNINTSGVLKIDQINFTVQCEPPTDAYLRTLFYHPAQDQMLPACIWSEVNADYVIKGNAECKIDIVQEAKATQHFLFYNITDEELKPHFEDFAAEYNIKDVFTPQNVLKNREQFVEYLRGLTTPIYLLPYVDNTTEYIFFEDIDLLHYPAYPLLGCSMGKPSVEINLDEISAVSQYGFKYVFDDNVKDILSDINVSFYLADTYSETSSVEDREESTLEKGAYVSGKQYFDNLNAVSQYAFTNGTSDQGVDYDEVDYILLDDGKTVIFNINSDTLAEIFVYDSTNNRIKWNLVDNPILDEGEMGITEYHLNASISSKSFQEWVDFEVDYDSKVLNFNDLSLIKKGEMKVEYHPLWIRGLNMGDFPLAMDLWIENYLLDEDGSYKVLWDTSDNSWVADEDSYIGKTNINPYTHKAESDPTYYVIETAVAPLDNIRKLIVNEDSENEMELMEDRDYFVDYLRNRITIYNQLESGSTISVRYTPNLTDTGLALAYRLHRPTYEDGVILDDNTGIVRENTDDCAIDIAADDVIIMDNYFTVRT